jgi:hypothetical protein
MQRFDNKKGFEKFVNTRKKLKISPWSGPKAAASGSPEGVARDEGREGNSAENDWESADAGGEREDEDGEDEERGQYAEGGGRTGKRGQYAEGGATPAGAGGR